MSLATTCGRPLGMASGNIYDYQIGATSADNGGVEGMPISSRGRLYHPDPGWCSTKKDKSPWFMVCNLNDIFAAVDVYFLYTISLHFLASVLYIIDWFDCSDRHPGNINTGMDIGKIFKIHPIVPSVLWDI